MHQKKISITDAESYNARTGATDAKAPAINAGMMFILSIPRPCAGIAQNTSVGFKRLARMNV